MSTPMTDRVHSAVDADLAVIEAIDLENVVARLHEAIDRERRHPSRPDGHRTKVAGASPPVGTGRPPDPDAVELTEVEATADARTRWRTRTTTPSPAQSTTSTKQRTTSPPPGPASTASTSTEAPPPPSTTTPPTNADVGQWHG